MYFSQRKNHCYSPVACFISDGSGGLEKEGEFIQRCMDSLIQASEQLDPSLLHTAVISLNYVQILKFSLK